MCGDTWFEKWDSMQGMKGRSVLTINSHPEMRAAFAGLRTEQVRIAYTMAGGGKRAEATELIVRNW